MFSFFFFNDTATTEIYTLSLHDALPISSIDYRIDQAGPSGVGKVEIWMTADEGRDRKSTRLNSSHSQISYAVFCLKKKKEAHRLLAHDAGLDGRVRDRTRDARLRGDQRG